MKVNRVINTFLVLGSLSISNTLIAQQAAPMPAGTVTTAPSTVEIKEVKIGNQIWMAENLAIATANSFAYKNDGANIKAYGRLYTWDAAMKACPKGWHLPSDAEWSQMINAIGGVANASIALRPGGSSGFNALTAGYKSEKGFEFDGKNTTAIFWSSTPFEGNKIWVRELKSFSPKALESYYDKNMGLSCRCVKDAAK